MRGDSPTTTSVRKFPKTQNTSEPPSPALYIWEGTISDLIEFATAIHEAKLVRKLSGELMTYTEIVHELQRIFGVKIANIYSRKTRAKTRKKTAAPLLERMLASYNLAVEKIYL